MVTEKRCPMCGSNKIVPGTFYNIYNPTEPIGFSPDKLRNTQEKKDNSTDPINVTNPTVSITIYACLRCGYLDPHINSKDLKKLMNKYKK